MRCPNCQTELPASAVVCSNCGTAVNAPGKNTVLKTFNANQSVFTVYAIQAVIFFFATIYCYSQYSNLPWWADDYKNSMLLWTAVCVFLTFTGGRAAYLSRQIKLTLHQQSLHGVYLVMLPFTNTKTLEISYKDVQDTRLRGKLLDLRVDEKWIAFNIESPEKAKEMIDQNRL